MIISLSLRNIERLLFSHDCFQQVCHGLIRLTNVFIWSDNEMVYCLGCLLCHVSFYFQQLNQYSDLLLPFLSMLLCMFFSFCYTFYFILGCVGLIWQQLVAKSCVSFTVYQVFNAWCESPVIRAAEHANSFGSSHVTFPPN